MSTRQKGDLCELFVLTQLVKRGYTIALPYGRQPGWDLLVEVNGKWEKWQVKMAAFRAPYKRHDKTLPYAPSTRSVGPKRIQTKYQKGDFDYLLAVDPERETIWKIPADIAIPKRSIPLRTNTFLWHPDPKEIDPSKLRLQALI
ncbi:hypothetical protein ES703_113774 [subsurface metagenome]